MYTAKLHMNISQGTGRRIIPRIPVIKPIPALGYVLSGSLFARDHTGQIGVYNCVNRWLQVPGYYIDQIVALINSGSIDRLENVWIQENAGLCWPGVLMELPQPLALQMGLQYTARIENDEMIEREVVISDEIWTQLYFKGKPLISTHEIANPDLVTLSEGLSSIAKTGALPARATRLTTDQSLAQQFT